MSRAAFNASFMTLPPPACRDLRWPSNSSGKSPDRAHPRLEGKNRFDGVGLNQPVRGSPAVGQR
jgi:hypothetical protein